MMLHWAREYERRNHDLMTRPGEIRYRCRFCGGEGSGRRRQQRAPACCPRCRRSYEKTEELRPPVSTQWLRNAPACCRKATDGDACTCMGCTLARAKDVVVLGPVRGLRGYEYVETRSAWVGIYGPPGTDLSDPTREQLDELVPAINPGVRRVVRLLNSLGYDTCDSGDGETRRQLFDRPYPYIVIRAQPWTLVEACNRLRATLRKRGLDLSPIAEGDVWLQGTYDPASGSALVELVGLTDAKLPAPRVG